MPNIIIIIQARMTSERLPGKVLLSIGEKPALQLMIERLPDWRENIIIATTNDGTETPIIQLCERLGVRYFRGDPEDVLGRYYETAKDVKAQAGDGIMRLTSDCPLIDNELVSQVIHRCLESDHDMVSLGPHSGFPRGMDCCLFRFDLLKRTHHERHSAFEREHVTQGMAHFPNLSSAVIHAPENLSHYRLTLDETDDYRAITEIYRLFQFGTDFSYEALVSVLKQNPHIYEINKHVEQKNAILG